MRYGTTTASGVIIFAFLYFLGMYRSEYYTTAAHTTPSLVARKAAGFVLPEANGGQVDSESYHGRPMLLMFWTISNSECRRELGLISQVAPDFRAKGIGVVAIHQGVAENLKDYLQTNHIAVTSLIDGDEEVSASYGVYEAHKLLLVGSDGKIKKVSDATLDESALRKWADEAGS
jgi:peroxiredoxin